MNELRKVEILVYNVWKETRFEDLKSGDIFRMFDGDDPVVGKGELLEGTTEWKAACDSYLRDGVWTINCELTDDDLKKYSDRLRKWK